MPTRKRKKSRRKRGSTTHGYGSKKKHRGAGSRGGRGNAGTGKRGQQKMPSVWKNKYLGQHGFTRNVSEPEINTINIIDLERKIDTFVEEGNAKKTKDVYEINLEDIGYQKLLGKGRATKKMKITAKSASEKAVEKVQNAGGEFIENGS